MRLDYPVQQGQGSIAGLEELEQLLKAAVKASFETRAAAYEEEVWGCMHKASIQLHDPASPLSGWVVLQNGSMSLDKAALPFWTVTSMFASSSHSAVTFYRLCNQCFTKHGNQRHCGQVSLC